MARVARGRNSQIVPALMFHSVGLDRLPWVWFRLSEPLAIFEEKIRCFVGRGFHSVFWDELYAYMACEKSLPRNSIFLTFDDGYLDNWVFIYPLLKKYGMKGTIFVNPDFVDPSEKPRPNLEDVWARRCSLEELQVPGFLNWAEMRAMERSGTIDIQSHAMTHTWYFSGPEILDFHSPEPVARYPWLFWNARPERKPFYLTEQQQDFVPLGFPIFEHRKSLVMRRFFPDEGLVKRITDFAADAGREQTFEQVEFNFRLRKFCERLLDGEPFAGRYEDNAERDTRLRAELADSKKHIEENLGKRVDYICWPGGGNDPHVQQLALEAGYKSWTLGSKDTSVKRNVPGADPVSIKRMGTQNRIRIQGREFGTGGARYQMLRILEHQRSRMHRVMLKLYLLSARLGIRFAL